MIEYIYDCIKASAGTDITIKAVITTNVTDSEIEGKCSLEVYDKDDKDIVIYNTVGTVTDGIWTFIIPAKITEGLSGRYWYCVKYFDNTICFKEPMYLM